MPNHGFFDIWGEAKMPRHKTEDQIATEKIVGQYQRENPEPEPPGRAVVSLETRDRMRRQKSANEDELKSWTCRSCGKRWKSKLDIWGAVCRGCARDDDDGGSWVPRKPKPRVLA